MTVRPWQLFPWAVAVLLLASAWGWQTRKNDWQPPAARLPQLPELAALPAPEAVQMRQSLARPVLWAARRPLDQGGRKGEESEIAKARLLAVVSSGQDLIALLARSEGSTLKITPRTRPWRIEAFDGLTATFVHEGSGQRVQRALERVLSPSPAAPAAAPAAGAAKKR